MIIIYWGRYRTVPRLIIVNYELSAPEAARLEGKKLKNNREELFQLRFFSVIAGPLLLLVEV